MQPPACAKDFIDLLEKSAVLDEQEFRSVVDQHGLLRQDSAKSAADLMLKQGLLTKYQAEHLLAGRYRGFVINQYVVQCMLGMGGMGRLFLAKDRATKATFALKILPNAKATDINCRTRFEREARAGARLSHLNIVRTFEISRSTNANYIAMEFIEGMSLQELVEQRGPMPVAQACDVILQSTHALDHLAQVGLVHRDIKPSNILINHEGTIKVIDFGLVLFDDDDEDLSLTMIHGANCLGTADYISPEQAYNSFTVDYRSDVYSLGCSLYFLLTGVVPFPVETIPLKLLAHKKKKPHAVRQLAPNVPGEVEDLVNHMMAKLPEKRCASLAELQAILKKYAQQTPVDFDYEQVLASRNLNLMSQRAETSSISRQSAVMVASGQSTKAHADTKPGNLDQIVPPAPLSRIAMDHEAPKKVDPFEVDSSEFEISAPKSKALMPGRLTPIAGGPIVKLMKNRVVIGRQNDCDLTIASPQVSSKHCEITWEDGGWRISDLGSKNGIRINGTDVQSKILIPGDKVTIARFAHYLFEQGKMAAEPTSSKKMLLSVVGGAVAALILVVVLILTMRS